MDLVFDGYWLPQTVRDLVLSSETEHATLSSCRGRTCEPGDEGAVTVRWPRLRAQQWSRLLAALAENRGRVPTGREYWERFQAALQAVGQRFADPSDVYQTQVVSALSSFTGYSEAMMRLVVDGLDLMSFKDFPAAFQYSPHLQSRRDWQAMPGLPGRLMFYEADGWRRAAHKFFGRSDRGLFGSLVCPGLAIGYGAGNVPGTALLIAVLAQSTTLTGEAPPATLVRNSRREPIFTSLVLRALEAEDPDLLAATAVLIWDYEDTGLQEQLLSQADLVIAAASDDTIAQIGAVLERVGPRRRPPRTQSVRFHAHGHKVSFSAIGREMAGYGTGDAIDGQALPDLVALLAALDSAFWDQNGCLSSRVHFVEIGRDADDAVQESGIRSAGVAVSYAERLAAQMRLLASYLPRGAWPLQQLRDRFDRYKLLESTGKVQVLSVYDDEFVVAVDQRPLDAAGFYSSVNDCQGRVIIVRPVADLMEVPELYLSLLPQQSLQSLSVAVGRPGEGLTAGFLRFAEACGARGVTAIRTVGRAAFPQLAYSWDGLIPADLVRSRPAGRFTTVEFDAPYEQIEETYRTLLRRGRTLGSGETGG